MKNLLIVDDERMFLMTLSESLRQSLDNIKVITAENGGEAIRVLGTMPVDLLLTDLQMPVKNGYELLEHVKEFYPNIPVIVMTAHVNSETINRLSYLGISEIVEKPLDFDDLVGKIRGLV